MAAKQLSWRDQLSRVREDVVRAERERELRKKMERERSRGALAERLKQDSPEALNARFNELKKTCQQVGQRLYPPDELRQQLAELENLEELLQYFEICKREHGDLFNTAMRQAMVRLRGELADIRKSIDKQLRQWRAVEALLGGTDFRPRTDKDDARLLEIAKSFSLAAHSLALSVPADYFATESENFYVAEGPGGVYGYVKYWSEANAISLGLEPPARVNFKKLLRGFFRTCCTRGPLAGKMDALRVRISDPGEFRFYQGLGFRRTALTSPVCTRPLD